MFDLGPKLRQKKPPVFSLDKREQRRMRDRSLSRTEWRVLIILPVLLLTIIWTIYDYRERIAALWSNAYDPIPPELTLRAMPRPAYDSLPALPAASEVDAARDEARRQVAANQPPPITALGLDAATLAWADERLAADLAAPPLPQRVLARDLVLADHVAIATPVVLDAELVDRLPAPVAGGTAWQRLLVALDEGQFAEVLAGPAAGDIALGLPVRIAGRVLTYHDLAATAADGAAVRVPVPVLLGRVVAERAVERRDDHLAEYHRPFHMPDGVLAECDDFRLWVETRPYYYALGQALRDRSDPAYGADAPDGNQMADDVHLDPPAFRGKPFRIVGFVYRAWEDPDVARDQPFGVARAVRLLLWRRDIAPVTETIDGTTARKLKQVLRLYELAVVTDQPLPERGAFIQATGRFLKKRAMAVDVDQYKDRINQIDRQSDRVYTWMYTATPWTELQGPPTYNLSPVAWAVSIIGLIAAVIGVRWAWIEVRHARANAVRIRAVRANAARLRQEAASQPPQDGQAPPPA